MKSCGREFTPGRWWQRCCSDTCRYAMTTERKRAARQRQREARAKEQAKRADVPRPKPKVRRRPAMCARCGGRHATDRHQNRVIVKLYGTVDAERRYVPPPGVAVRIMRVTREMNGERLHKVLRELDG